MKLAFANPEETAIRATLDEGESLGSFSGPGEIFVPTDPANAEYQAILASGQPIEPYTVPPLPTSAVISQSSQALKVSQARQLNAQGRTAEAQAMMLNLLENKI